jgi:hypothetical protein
MFGLDLIFLGTRLASSSGIWHLASAVSPGKRPDRLPRHRRARPSAALDETQVKEPQQGYGAAPERVKPP